MHGLKGERVLMRIHSGALITLKRANVIMYRPHSASEKLEEREHR